MTGSTEENITNVFSILCRALFIVTSFVPMWKNRNRWQFERCTRLLLLVVTPLIWAPGKQQTLKRGSGLQRSPSIPHKGESPVTITIVSSRCWLVQVLLKEVGLSDRSKSAYTGVPNATSAGTSPVVPRASFLFCQSIPECNWEGKEGFLSSLCAVTFFHPSLGLVTLLPSGTKQIQDLPP